MVVDKLRSPYVLAYIDDIIIHTPDMETHVEQLQQVFQIHRESGIRLTAEKTILFQEEADYLGFRVAQDGIHMKESYIQKVLDWPTPKTVKELKLFLGFCSYYRTFIPKFSILTAAMNGEKRKKKLEWTEEMQTNFEILKSLFEKKPIRAYPDYSEGAEPFEIWPDFSAQALGGVLQQKQDGQRRLIAAGGRKTSKGEANYPPTKGELASIIHHIRKYEHILRFKLF